MPSATSLNLTVQNDTTQVVVKRQTVTVPKLENGIAKIGLAQTKDMASPIVVQVDAMAGGITVGHGSASVEVVPGRNAGPVTVTVKKSAVLSDGGATDTRPSDAGTPDAVAYDVGVHGDAQAQSTDTGSVGGLDASPVQVDGIFAPDSRMPTAGDDSTAVDLSTRSFDGAPIVDLPISIADALPADASTTVSPDASVDLSVDVPPDVVSRDAGTILGTLPTCKKYVHYPNSPATCPAGSEHEKVLVYTTALTPDGKYLVTASNNAWVKIWKVVDSGLEDTGIVLVGESYRVTATVSPTGALLAVPSSSGNVALYDLKETLVQGSGMQVGTLSASKLAKAAQWDYHQVFFSGDEKQVVVNYSAANSVIENGGNVGVWDLTTRTVLREFAFDFPTRAFTVSNAPAAGPWWTVMGTVATVSDDGGTHEHTTVLRLDVSGTTTVKPTFVVPGEVNRALFSADNRTLAVGTTDGAISIWDLSTLNDIQRLGSPLVQGGTGAGVYGLGFSTDGQFLAAGTWIYQGISSLWILNPQTRAVVKRDLAYEPRSFAFVADGTTWGYGLGGCGFLYFCK